MDNQFMEISAFELGEAIRKNPWDLWVARAEKLLGHSLDGNQKQDGYSLDYAYVAFCSAVTAEQYVSSIAR